MSLIIGFLLHSQKSLFTFVLPVHSGRLSGKSLWQSRSPSRGSEWGQRGRAARLCSPLPRARGECCLLGAPNGVGDKTLEKHSFIPAIDFCQETDSFLQITSFSMQMRISSSKKETRQGENFVFWCRGRSHTLDMWESRVEKGGWGPVHTLINYFKNGLIGNQQLDSWSLISESIYLLFNIFCPSMPPYS